MVGVSGCKRLLALLFSRLLRSQGFLERQAAIQPHEGEQ